MHSKLTLFCREHNLEFPQAPSYPEEGEGLYTSYWLDSEECRCGRAVIYLDCVDITLNFCPACGASVSHDTLARELICEQGHSYPSMLH